jgi:hypothetical protein
MHQGAMKKAKPYENKNLPVPQADTGVEIGHYDDSQEIMF